MESEDFMQQARDGIRSLAENVLSGYTAGNLDIKVVEAERLLELFPAGENPRESEGYRLYLTLVIIKGQLALPRAKNSLSSEYGEEERVALLSAYVKQQVTQTLSGT